MKVRLKDYVELVSDKTKNNKDIDSYVSTENLLSDKQGVRFPATSVSNSKYIQTYRKDDVLISNIRPYFKKIWKAERSGTHSNDVLCFRSKTDSLLQNFLYIILQSDRFFEFVSKNSKGTKMPRGDKKAIMQYEFELPSLSEQIKISNQVLSFEDKVLLNNQINDNLFELNKIIFNKVFASSKNYVPASDIAEIKIGKTPPRKEKQWFSVDKGINWLSIKDMKSEGIFSMQSKEKLLSSAINKFNIQTVNEDTVLLSFKLTIGRVKLAAQEMVTNEAIAQFKNSKLPYQYLYTYLKLFHFETLGSTSSIAKAINSKILKSMPILKPSTDDLNKYMNTAKPIFEKVKINQLENINLLNIKKYLLNKLK